MDKASTIHSLFSKKINDLAFQKDVPIKNENQPSDVETDLYFREWLMLSRPRAAGCGTSAKNYIRGVYQVDIVGSIGGWGESYEYADDIAAEFKRGTQLSDTDVDITCESVTPGPGYREESRYTLPVSINFYAYIGV